ncbi:MAG: hypothetical protein ACREF3_00765 [Acetobacteraceae bacterium]
MPAARVVEASRGRDPPLLDSATPVSGAATLWPAARVSLAAKLWGEGFIGPGGEAEVLRLAAPLGLSEASSLLLLGCGAGGPARCISAYFGAWVSGFEADAGLAAAGADLCGNAGLGRHPQVAAWHGVVPEINRRSCHHALALEAMRGSAPESLFGALALALRHGAQVTLVETVAAPEADPDDPEIAAWSRLDGRITPVPREAVITNVLSRLGFEVRVVENISARHVTQATHAWVSAVRVLQAIKLSSDEVGALHQEAELWDMRLGLMRADRIRLMRWHAIHRGMD